MNSWEIFAEEWKKVEKGPRPTRVRNILQLDFGTLPAEMLESYVPYATWLVEHLYAGDVIIYHNAFPRWFMDTIKKRTMEFYKTRPSEHYKMLEGCPNFHRVIDLETGKKYSFNVCKHSSFFYNWNDDPLFIRESVYDVWRSIKILMGLHPLTYETNTPKDGVVDRIQVAQYPSKIGFLEPHSDPYLHQRLFLSGYMSERGVDYEGGGFYLVGENDKVVDAEAHIKCGDIAVGYATVYHGVAPCNRHLEPDWESDAGRWFLSMYSNASDEKPDRHTGHPVKLKLEGVLP